jgi:hypothetical protein
MSNDFYYVDTNYLKPYILIKLILGNKWVN